MENVVSIKDKRKNHLGPFKTSCYCRVAQQALPCYTTVARLGFKRRATAVPNSIYKL